MNELTVRDIVIEITNQADELLRKGKNNLNEVEMGELIAFTETLCIIQDACLEYAKDIGLDYDIDKKYLY